MSRQPKPKRFNVWCAQCYSCTVKETDGKHEANRAATSHMVLYPGHRVSIIDRKTENA